MKLICLFLLLSFPVFTEAKVKSTEQEITDSLRLAEIYLLDGATSGALGIVGMLIDKYPSDVRAYIFASKSFLAKGDVNAAVKVLREALEKVDNQSKAKVEPLLTELTELAQKVNKEQLISSAMESLDSENYEVAGQHFELLFALDRENFEYASMAIDSYLLAGNNDGVIRLISAVDLGIVPSEEIDSYLQLTALLKEPSVENRNDRATGNLTESSEDNRTEGEESSLNTININADKQGDCIRNTIGINMRLISASRLSTGPTNEEKDYDYETEKNLNVDVEEFYISETEITQTQWNALMPENPSVMKGDDIPVHRVSIFAAKEFIRKLSRKEKRKYRLPTEFEWEVACKQGDNTIYAGTNEVEVVHQFANFKSSNRNKSPKPVASLKPNKFGLFDLSGNAYEWVTENKAYPGLKGFNIIKGGSWSSSMASIRCAHRSFVPEGDFEIDTSFRVVISKTDLK